MFVLFIYNIYNMITKKTVSYVPAGHWKTEVPILGLPLMSCVFVTSQSLCLRVKQ